MDYRVWKLIEDKFQNVSNYSVAFYFYIQALYSNTMIVTFHLSTFCKLKVQLVTRMENNRVAAGRSSFMTHLNNF